MGAELGITHAAAAIYTANQGHLRPLLAYLRADRPMSADDKALLADMLEGKLRKDRSRGKPPEPLYSETWYLRQTVDEIRRISKQMRISLEDATVIAKISATGRPFRFDLEKILRELRRSQRPRKPQHK